MQGALGDDLWRGGVVFDQYFGIGFPGGFETLTLRVRSIGKPTRFLYVSRDTKFLRPAALH